MKFFKNRNLVIKAFAFLVVAFFVFSFLVKLFVDFPTYPPSSKSPLTWKEVLECLDFIVFSSFITTFIFVYSLYLSHYKKKK